MVEENSVYREQAVAFAGVDGHPVAVQLGAAVGAARMKRSGFILRTFVGLSVHFAAGGIVKTSGDSGFANGVEQARGSQGGDVAGVFWNVETDADMALGTQVINLVRGNAIEQLGKTTGVG